MTMDDTEFEVTTSPPLSDPSPPNKPITNSYNATGLLGHKIQEAQVVSENSNRLQDTCNNDSKSQFNMPMLIDSGASDHCFVNRESFISLTPLHQPTMGFTATKESIFNVTGKGKAKIETCVNGTNRNIIFEDVLHTPELRSNLISVSKLAKKGVKVEFDQHKARVRSVSSAVIMTAKRCGHLYTIETTSRTPTALVSQTKRQPATFDTWHRRFGHAAPETIREIAVKTLVDGLNITGELIMGGRCEDCIFGKHSTHPFNDNGYQETEILERTHIDI